MSSSLINRRGFLSQSGCAALTSIPVLNTILNLTMAGRAAAQAAPPDGRRKALVCIFLAGGCDTFNVLVPRDAARHAEYAAARGGVRTAANPAGLGLDAASLQALDFAPPGGALYGLHPSLAQARQLFNGIGGDTTKRRLSLIANIGTLIEPVVNKAAYLAGSVNLPKALFSHRDQIEQWQTSVPQGQSLLTGWMGRAADVLFTPFHAQDQTAGYYMPMNFSVSGNSVIQTGAVEGQFVLTASGALNFTAYTNPATQGMLAKQNAALRDITGGPVEQNYRNLFDRAFAKTTRNASDRSAEFSAQFNAPGTINGLDIEATLTAANFPGSPLGQNLRAIAKCIALREPLKLRRQTFFAQFGGWDHHFELINTQAGMLASLDAALAAFQRALELFGVQDDVVTFTASDFGRTIRSNGKGTDHAWGGNHLVFGGPVDGGKVFGTWPSLVLEGASDVGYGGRIFPTTSCDAFFCEMLRWFGVTNADMPSVLPNIGNFYNVASAAPPIGFLKPGA